MPKIRPSIEVTFYDIYPDQLVDLGTVPKRSKKAKQENAFE